MKIKKTDRIVKEGDPIFEKLKSQMRPDLRKGLKQIVLIGGNKTRCYPDAKRRDADTRRSRKASPVCRTSA